MCITKIYNKKYTPQPQQTHKIHAKSKIARNSNYIENYYTNTTPSPQKEIQNHYGLINYIQLKMQKWTTKHKKIPNTQQLDNPIN